MAQSCTPLMVCALKTSQTARDGIAPIGVRVMRLFNSQYLHEQQRHVAPSYRGRGGGHRYGGRGPRIAHASRQTGASNDDAGEANPAREILQRMAAYDQAA